MKTYILLFRGINVGGHNVLPMKALTAMLEQAGYQQVKTYIQTGNVVLNSDVKPGPEITHQIEKQFGFKPQLMVWGKPQFDKAVQNNPFSSEQGKTIHFFFLQGKPIVDAGKLALLATATEQYQLIDQVFYLHAPDGIGRSKLAANVEKCMGIGTTARNLNTVNKLVSMTSV